MVSPVYSSHGVNTFCLLEKRGLSRHTSYTNEHVFVYMYLLIYLMIFFQLIRCFQLNLSVATATKITVLSLCCRCQALCR